MLWATTSSGVPVTSRLGNIVGFTLKSTAVDRPNLPYLLLSDHISEKKLDRYCSAVHFRTVLHVVFTGGNQ